MNVNTKFSEPVLTFTPPPIGSDRRGEPRQDCDIKGCLLFVSEQKIYDCHILDQSACGAKILVETRDKIEDELWLIDCESRVLKRGRPVWVRANILDLKILGLRFNLIQTLKTQDEKPSKVPQAVYNAWKRLTSDEAEAYIYLD
jgi:hypothetical protein